jgi:hypothetical protein
MKKKKLVYWIGAIKKLDPSEKNNNLISSFSKCII